MATKSEADIAEMSEEQRIDYCDWCWHKHYGNCDLCAISRWHEAKRAVNDIANDWIMKRAEARMGGVK